MKILRRSCFVGKSNSEYPETGGLPVRRQNKLTRFGRTYGMGLLFAGPFLILFFLFTVLPVLNAVWLSLTDYDTIREARFIGIENYRQLFMNDEVFLKALRNTLLFAVIVGPLTYILSFLMAWVINGLKGKNAFALAFYAPSITSATAMSVVWLYFFSPDRYGLINNWLYGMGLITTPVLWTSDYRFVLPVVMLVSVWMGMGSGFLVFLAGFQNASQELNDAASVDGVGNRFQQLWYVTLPQMKPQLLFGAINAVSGAMGVFDVAVSIAGMPSPNYAAHTIVTHLYDYAFIRFEMGYACAVAVVLFVLTYAIGKICMRALRE